MNFVFTILKNPKVLLGIGIAAAFIAVYFVGKHNGDAERKAQDEQAIRDAALIVKHSERKDSTDQPIQHLEGQAEPPKPVKPQIIFRTIPADSSWKSWCDSLFRAYQELYAESEKLKDTARATLHDSLGGTHNLSYVGETRRFSEVFLPPKLITTTIENDTTRNILLNDDKHWLFGFNLEHRGELGIGVTLGREPISFTPKYYPGAEPGKKWGIQANYIWRF